MAGIIPSGEVFLLFVRGEEERDDDARDLVRHLPRLRAFDPIPPGWTLDVERQAKAGRPPRWRLPAHVQSCVELVLDLAQRTGRQVRLVDVNQPEEAADLVRQWVGPSDLLPVLISPRGERLEGTGAFVPRTVRAFLRHGTL